MYIYNAYMYACYASGYTTSIKGILNVYIAASMLNCSGEPKST